MIKMNSPALEVLEIRSEIHNVKSKEVRLFTEIAQTFRRMDTYSNLIIIIHIMN